jgi:hypothetical protein
MKRVLIAAAAVLLGAASAGAIEQYQRVHATPPLLPHPLPQGTPYFVVGGPSHAPIELRYGEVYGKRILVEAQSGERVYRLVP